MYGLLHVPAPTQSKNVSETVQDAVAVINRLIIPFIINDKSHTDYVSREMHLNDMLPACVRCWRWICPYAEAQTAILKGHFHASNVT
jgi:hypothetical protein